LKDFSVKSIGFDDHSLTLLIFLKNWRLRDDQNDQEIFINLLNLFKKYAKLLE